MGMRWNQGCFQRARKIQWTRVWCWNMDTSCESGIRLTNVGQSFNRLGKTKEYWFSIWSWAQRTVPSVPRKRLCQSLDNQERINSVLVSPSCAASADFPERCCRCFLAVHLILTLSQGSPCNAQVTLRSCFGNCNSDKLWRLCISTRSLLRVTKCKTYKE